jgi:Flp pilus assembly protein TadG
LRYLRIDRQLFVAWADGASAGPMTRRPQAQAADRRRARGVAAVELGFLLIPLVVLVFGVTEYGRAIYTYNTITKSARDAARYLTSKTPGSTADHQAAACLVVTGDASHSGATCTSSVVLAPGLTPDMVETCDAVLTCAGVTSTFSTGSGTINTVHVGISGYPFTSVVDFVAPSINFNNISVTMRSQL